MELKEFIKVAISDITAAISELQEELRNNSVVSPPMPGHIPSKTLMQYGKNRLISNVDFDVAITVGSVDSFDGHTGAGILEILSAKFNSGNESRAENVSRLTFSIPIIYPTAEFETDQDLKDKSIKESLRLKRPGRPTAISVEDPENEVQQTDRPSNMS